MPSTRKIAATPKSVLSVWPRCIRRGYVPDSCSRQVASGNSCGVGTITAIVFGGLFITLVVGAWHILPFFYYYFDLQNQMAATIRVAQTLTDEELRHRIWQQVEKLEIPADRRDLRVERVDGRIRISLPYREVLYLRLRGKDYDLHEFHFTAKAEGPYR